MKTFLPVLVSALTLTVSQTPAAQLSGTINFGATAPIQLNSSDFQTVTAVDFTTGPGVPNAIILPGASGDFSSLASQTVVFQDFTIGASVNGEWTLPLTPGWSFDLANSSNFSPNNTFLNIAGTGVLHAPSFSDTPGSFTLTASRSGSSQIEFSFAASTTGLGQTPPEGFVPDGGSTALLLSTALLSVAAAGLRRKQ